jgi:hypothetical protein
MPTRSQPSPGLRDTPGRREVSGREELRPQQVQPGSPAPQRVTPGPRRTALSSLASSLAELQPSLQRFAVQELTVESERQELEGGSAAAQALLEEEARTYKEAVEEGIISQSQNPFFRLGMKRQFAIAAANDYAQQVETLAGELLAQEVTDPSVFKERELQLRRSFLEETRGERDAGFDRFFVDRVNQQVANIAQNFARSAGALMGQQALRVLDIRVNQSLRNAYTEYGHGNIPGLIADVGAQLDALGREYVQELNISGGQVNRVLFDAVVAWAHSQGVPEVLGEISIGREGERLFTPGGILERITTPGGTLADITEFHQLAEQAALIDIPDRIEIDRRQEQSRMLARRRQNHMDFAENFSQYYVENGTWEGFDFEPWIQTALQTADDELLNVMRARTTELDEIAVIESGPELDHLVAMASVGDITLPQAVARWRGGTLSDRGLQRVLGAIQQHISLERAMAAEEMDPRAHDALKERFSEVDKLARPTNLESLSLEAQRALTRSGDYVKRELRERFLRWYHIGGGREAGFDDQEQWLLTEFDRLSRLYFPLRDELPEGASVFDINTNRPNPFGQEPVLTPGQVESLRDVISGDGQLSSGLVEQLIVYGIPMNVLTFEDPEYSLNYLDRIERGQSAVLRMVPRGMNEGALDEEGNLRPQEELLSSQSMIDPRQLSLPRGSSVLGVRGLREGAVEELALSEEPVLAPFRDLAVEVLANGGEGILTLQGALLSRIRSTGLQAQSTGAPHHAQRNQAIHERLLEFFDVIEAPEPEEEPDPEPEPEQEPREPSPSLLRELETRGGGSGGSGGGVSDLEEAANELQQAVADPEGADPGQVKALVQRIGEALFSEGGLMAAGGAGIVPRGISTFGKIATAGAPVLSQAIYGLPIGIRLGEQIRETGIMPDPGDPRFLGMVLRAMGMEEEDIRRLGGTALGPEA